MKIRLFLSVVLLSVFMCIGFCNASAVEADPFYQQLKHTHSEKFTSQISTETDFDGTDLLNSSVSDKSKEEQPDTDSVVKDKKETEDFADSINSEDDDIFKKEGILRVISITVSFLGAIAIFILVLLIESLINKKSNVTDE